MALNKNCRTGMDSISNCPLMTKIGESVRQKNEKTSENVCVKEKHSSERTLLMKEDKSRSVGSTCLTKLDGNDKHGNDFSLKEKTDTEVKCSKNRGCACCSIVKLQKTCPSVSANVPPRGQPFESSSTSQRRKSSNLSIVSSSGGSEEGERKLDLRGLIESIGTLLIPVVSIKAYFPLGFLSRKYSKLFPCERHPAFHLLYMVKPQKRWVPHLRV